MKKIFFYISLFVILIFLSPSKAEAASIIITGGDYSGATGGSGDGMRININAPVWKTKPPGSSLTLNDLRNTPKIIDSKDAAVYLSADVFVGYIVRDPKLININELKSRTKRAIDILESSITIDSNQLITYTYTEKHPIRGTIEKINSIPMDKDLIINTNGYRIHRLDRTGIFYRGELKKDVWTSWKSEPYPTSGMPLKTWTEYPWDTEPFNKYANYSLWGVLRSGIPSDPVNLPEGVPPIVRNSSGSLMYGNPSTILKFGELTIKKIVKNAGSSGVNKSTTFKVYIKDSKGNNKDSVDISQNKSVTVKLPYGQYSIEENPTVIVSGKILSPSIEYSQQSIKLGKDSNGNGEEKITVTITNTFGDGNITVKKELAQGYELAGIDNTTEFKFKVKGPDGYITGTQTPAKTVKYTGTSSSGSTFTFSNKQPAIISGLPLGDYTVEEVDIPENCTVSYSKSNLSLLSSKSSDSITITNEFKVDSGSIEITKELAGLLPKGVNDNTVYKASIMNTETGEYLTLKSTGSSYQATGFSTNKNLVNIKASQSTTITNVPVGEYKITEENIAGFTPEYSSTSLNVTKDKKVSITIKNVYDGSFTISKEIVNPPTGVNNSTNFKGTVYVDNKAVSFTKSGNNYTYKSNGTVKEVTFSANSPALIKGLPAGSISFKESSPNPAPQSIDYNNISSGSVVSGIKVINTYTADGTPPEGGGGTPVEPKDAPNPSNEKHPCIWKNPPDEKIETKLSLVYVGVNKVSDISSFSTKVLLNRSGESAESLFNNPVTSFNYNYTSIEKEHNFVLGINVKQVVVEKHTWYTLTPGWHDVQFEKFKHGTGIGAYDGWLHDNDGTYSYLSCRLEEHTHSEACYDEDNVLVCGKSEHTHTSKCYSTGYYPCVHPKPCLHVVWKYPPAGLPQWQKNEEYRIRDEKVTSLFPSYTRIIPQLKYKYFYPFNIATGSPETNNASVNRLLGDTTNQNLLISSDLHKTGIENGALVGINNNSPTLFSIYFGNNQFGIPTTGDGFKLENSLPPEGVYPYETQYYWNGRLFFGPLDNSRSDLPSESIVSLQYGDMEKLNKDIPWSVLANSGFTGGLFGFRSIKTSGKNANGTLNNFILGANNKPSWYAEFDYGLRYRYGIEYNISISTGMVNDSVKSFPWSVLHQVPPKSTFKSSFTNPIIRANASRIDDIWTGENHDKIYYQPIIYGEFTIKTVGGY